MSNVATSEIEDARSLKISSIFFLSHEEMEGYNFEGDEIDLKKNSRGYPSLACLPNFSESLQKYFAESRDGLQEN